MLYTATMLELELICFQRTRLSNSPRGGVYPTIKGLKTIAVRRQICIITPTTNALSTLRQSKDTLKGHSVTPVSVEEVKSCSC